MSNVSKSVNIPHATITAIEVGGSMSALAATHAPLEAAPTDYPTIDITATKGRDCWLLRFDCPWCGKTHTHGGGPLDGTPDAGHRVSHCHAPGTPSGYELVIVGEEAGR